MSLNKRFTGDFTIESIDSGETLVMDNLGKVTITGDFTVLGDTTLINTTDLEIVDNTIILNSGETGPGVTLVTAGIEIDRGDGTSSGHHPAGLRFNEGVSAWEVMNGDDAETWTAISTATGFELLTDLTPQLGGPLDVNGQIITSAAAGDVVITPDAGGDVLISTLTTGIIDIASTTTAAISAVGTASLISAGAGVTVTGQTVTTVSSTINNVDISAGTDITLAATGMVKIEQEITLLEQAAPGIEVGYNKLYAGTAAEGGSGLYFVNDTETDELVSKKKAIAYSIIF